MSNSKHINVFLTSKNRGSYEKPCEWLVRFPSGLIKCKENEGIRLNVLSFHIPNNFYNINEKNNQFSVIVRDENDNIVLSEIFDVTPGNYSVFTFRDYINDLCKSYFTMTYNVARNTYTIKSIYSDDTKTVFLKIHSAGQFFGLSNSMDIEYELTPEGEEMDYTINMCSFDKIVLRSYGLNPELTSISNIGPKDTDKEFERSPILLWVSRNDVPINGMIRYENYDGGDSFCYNLYDTEINEFKLIITDEYNNTLDSSLDYTLLLRFEIYEKQNQKIDNLYKELKVSNSYLQLIEFYFLNVLDKFKIINSDKI